MSRRAAALALAVPAVAAAALAVPAAAGADEVEIGMPGKFFDPARVTAVAGDRITFANRDLVTHDVRIGGGLFDSGPILRSGSWSQPFERPGEYPFACTLHAFMNGNLSVVAATLSSAPDQVLAGEPITLSGRAPAGTPRVIVERSTPAARVGRARRRRHAGRRRNVHGEDAGGGGRVATGSRRPAGASASLTPKVTARVEIHTTLERGKRRLTLRAHAMPAPTGMVATLDLYARWRYRWRVDRAVKFDRHGMATVRLPRGLRTYARVSLRRRARRAGARLLARAADVGRPRRAGPGHDHAAGWRAPRRCGRRRGRRRARRALARPWCTAPRPTPAARCARARSRACGRGRRRSCGAAPRRGRGPRPRRGAGTCGSATSRRWTPPRSGAR